MTRAEINQVIAQTSGVDVVATEKVLVGLEKVVFAQMSTGGNKFARIAALYQNWKNN